MSDTKTLLEKDAKTLLEKVTEAQLKVENPKFDKAAQYGKYSSLKECFRVVNEACNPLGLSVYHDIAEVDGGYLVSTVITDGVDTVTRSPFPANFGTKPQTNGSELTYAKRYSLCAAFGIVGEEDDDGQSAQNAPRQDKKKNQLSDELIAAKGALGVSAQGYAERHNRNIDDVKNGISKRPDFEANKLNPDWYYQVASELDAA